MPGLVSDESDREDSYDDVNAILCWCFSGWPADDSVLPWSDSHFAVIKA